MPTDKVVKVLFWVSQISFVLCVMFTSAFFAAVLSAKTKLDGPVLTAWLVGEAFGTIIIVLTMTEIILSFGPLGYLVDQSIKLLLSIIETGLAFGAGIATMSYWNEEPLFWIPIVALAVLLVLFIFNFTYALLLFRVAQDPSESGETTPLLRNSP